MRCSPTQILWVLALGCLPTQFLVIVESSPIIGVEDVCADFADGKSAWTVAECTEVWTQFTDAAPESLRGPKRQVLVDALKEPAEKLRRAGTPCLAASTPHGDGVGSTTMRIIASWLLSKEMGCDWVTPDWGKPHVPGANGTVRYCHRTVEKSKMDLLNQTETAETELEHCSVVDWLSYFHFSVPSVSLPEGANIKEIEIGFHGPGNVGEAAASITEGEFAEQGFDRVLFTYDFVYPARNFLAVGNWDENRRRYMRDIIGQARENFHVYPRPWYDGSPKCAFDPDTLNFSIHVRMGDRRAILGDRLEYFRYLEEFMDTVSKEVVAKGLQPPLFHVFSETLIPCPSEDTGLFDEFPTWPVHQVPGCWTPETPEDCLEKYHGHKCNPVRPGIFEVIGMPLVLHLSPDVHNALSCMIQADGLLMGCSTFGHIAGIFTRGISFFSMHCTGYWAPVQYKMVPPMAVAEHGHLWVPVAGSWIDPVLEATGLLSGALDTHLGNTGRV